MTTRAEQDTGVLLVVDALADHGRSGGVDGAASSLDVTVRAAAAIAEHHVRMGDRVSLRVIGAGHEYVGYGAGAAAPAGAPRPARPAPRRASRATSRPSGCSSGPPPGRS